MSLSQRNEYTVKDVVNDLKKMDATPSIAYELGNQLVYSQWTRCNQVLGSSHQVTKHFKEFLDFLQRDYENMLVRGDFWRANDTPNAAFNKFLKDRPNEFVQYTFERDPEYIFSLLKKASVLRKNEVKKYKAIKKNLNRLMKDNPDDSGLWNELRLVLWIIGDYKAASEAFKTAMKNGWEGSISTVVGL